MSTSTNNHTHVTLSTKNGPLAQIWLAANLNSINRNIAKTNIVESVEEIAKAAGVSLDDESVEPITLRASGELLHGVVKVYSQKASYLLTDISDLLSKVKSIFKGTLNKTVTIQLDTVAKLDQLLLQDVVTELDVLETPSLDFLNDVQIPEAFLSAERSMERQVQGAAPVSSLTAQQQAWDMSIEVGRRFLGDDDDINEISRHQDSSHLKLDFDLGESNQTSNAKSWGEGTRTTANDMEGEGDLTLKNMGNDDDDEDELLPLNDEWDLGLNDTVNDISGNVSQHESDRSIEQGRRADDNYSLHDDSHLDFDLGLPKEPEDQEERDAEQEPLSPVKPVKKRQPRNAAFMNIKKIVVDEDLELKDSEVKEGPSETILSLRNEDVSSGAKRRRNIEELYTDLDFLPDRIVSNLFNYNGFKKLRTLSQSRPDEESDVDIDISLGMDESLIQNSDPFDHQDIDFGNESAGPLFENVPRPKTAGRETSMDIQDNSLIQSDDFDTNESVEEDKTPKVELNTGEVVSKSTVEMASLLREEMTSGETTFERVMESKYKDNGALVTKGMASKAFFELLSLATSDCISLRQEDTFGEIKVLGKSNLYEKFVAA